MKNWDYALLSERAKAAGGPEKLVEQLFEEGRQLGIKQTWTNVAIGAGVTVGVTAIVFTIANMVAKKKKKAEIEKLKCELIQGIKDYDKRQETEKANTEISETEEPSTKSAPSQNSKHSPTVSSLELD